MIDESIKIRRILLYMTINVGKCNSMPFQPEVRVVEVRGVPYFRGFSPKILLNYFVQDRLF